MAQCHLPRSWALRLDYNGVLQGTLKGALCSEPVKSMVPSV